MLAARFSAPVTHSIPVNPPPLSTGYQPTLWRLRTVSRLGRLLYVCRVPALVGMLLALLGTVEQIHEVVRVLTSDALLLQGDAGTTPPLLWTFFLLYLLTWTLLFWSQFAIHHRMPGPWLRAEGVRWAARALPSVLAALPWVGAGLALQGAATGLAGNGLLLVRLLQGAAAFTAVASLAYYHRGWWHAVLLGEPPPPPRSFEASATTFGHRGLIVLSLTFGLLLFGLALWNPWWLGAQLGTVGTLVAACVALLPALTWLTTAPQVPQWHLLSLLVSLAVAWSAADLNDNHPVRPLPQQRPDFVPFQDLESAFAEWVAAREGAYQGRSMPVVLVAAEGGGIRAAYFTAMVLATLQDRCPALAGQVFAISGVSGGSVGAAIFTGLVQQLQLPLPSQVGCGASAPGTTPLAEQVDQILRTDFLAPTVVTMLFPDALQRLLPVPVDSWDRALTLERTLERSFQAVTKSDFMERSLYRYWRPEGAAPLLLLNTTLVSTGERVVASPMVLMNERFHDLRALVDHAPSLDLRISTAAVLSARFPGVTPAAYLAGEPKLRLVDGGYFENSGAATLGEVLATLRFHARTLGKDISPVVIRIANAPPVQQPPDPPTGLGELLSPIRTMVNTRAARGELAARALKAQVTGQQDEHECAEFIEFEIQAGGAQLPLGWHLSQGARQAIRAHLRPPADCSSRSGIYNGCAVQDVIERIENPFPACRPSTASSR